MVRLTDAELNVVMQAAAPLQPQQRRAFLQAVADALTPFTDVGDGVIYRVCVEVQKRFRDPPSLDGTED